MGGWLSRWHLYSPTITQAEAEMCVTMETSGAITGVAYWFELALGDNQTISTGPSAYEGVCPHLLFIVLMCSVRVVLSLQYRIP